HDGAELPGLIDKQNTASDVWADTAYRSAKNEEHLARNGLRSPPSQEAEGQADAGGHRKSQREKVQGSSRRRACPRQAKGADGACHPHHRVGQGESENRPRQSHLQHETHGLADGSACNRIIGPQRPPESQTARRSRPKSERKALAHTHSTSPPAPSPPKTWYLEVSSCIVIATCSLIECRAGEIVSSRLADLTSLACSIASLQRLA